MDPRKFIAEYTGTTLAMIEQHYGRFLEAEAGAQLRLLDGAQEAKPSIFDERLTVDARKYVTQGASPRGFVPHCSRASRSLRS